ncbi:hypothetical protein SanaruYs_38550 [Chryseotalea sanaruensis]|uniref:Uncharacterized protein n=1 Tax=Chryseotalea sanaruensis TaxID=2482724 RepID=A0A401UFI4_9BACT|nr:hypothetical protein SanaruYs_38550 [Chryseotalea sanaruensis]
MDAHAAVWLKKSGAPRALSNPALALVSINFLLVVFISFVLYYSIKGVKVKLAKNF